MNDSFAVHSAFIRGVEACPVTVEVSFGGGVPNIQLVGMADSSVLESRSRIRCALRSTGFEVPRRSITVNLSPGNLRKTGTAFDLPIAVAILAASGQIPSSNLDACLFVGEMALNGSLLPVSGEVAFQLHAREMGLTLVSGPSDQHTSLPGVDHGYIDTLAALKNGVAEGLKTFASGIDAPGCGESLDFSDVLGQDMAKRALAIAATGDLGLMMIGSPGSGKSMLAQRMSTILPPMDDKTLQEALCIHSVAGEDIHPLLMGSRPFRSPHHSISMAGLIGGNRPVRPGEISLAHGGILYLDEMGEFSNAVLQALRQPIEQGSVRVVRAEGAFTFPARFRLLAASNPCPCGYLGDHEVQCRCSAAAIERYRAKLRGPLADRIDIIVQVSRPDPELIVSGVEGLSTRDLDEMVHRGREFREWRQSRHADTDEGCSLMDSTKESFFNLDESGQACVLEMARKTHLTGRGIVRLSRIARSIADIGQSESISRSHVIEAAMYQGRRDV